MCCPDNFSLNALEDFKVIFKDLATKEAIGFRITATQNRRSWKGPLEIT